MARILVIDDDAAMRRTVIRILRGAGHEVAEAQNGVEGIESCKANRPDIVVTDIFMPQKEGIETIMDLRQEHPSILVLAMSGGSTGRTAPAAISGASHYLDMAQALGADGALGKPFRAEELLRAIDKLLQSRTPEV